MDERLSALLRLRAQPPMVSSAFVVRPRLAEGLTAAVGHPVTVMSAGPGYGKTLTLASWSHSRADSGRLAWLSIDETDNDVRAFWSDVLGSLAIAGALPRDRTLREVMHASGFGSREAQLVLTALAEMPAVVTLVLDDFHLISDTRVQESVGQLLEHQPPQLRLVLATRFDPALRLNRLRVNGDLTDFRADDLAFTRDEAAELLHGNDIHLTDHELGILLDHTQGWAAGLRLVMMRLDPADLDRGIAQFIGRNRLVAEYLIEEVIDRLTAVDRQFLLMTSVADRISGPLADELTGRSDGQIVLERLMIQNTLLVGLGANNEWFIVHPMLRAVLAHRLAVEQPGAVRELHLRSSRWFALHAEPIHAIRHAVAAEDWDEVGRLLTSIAWPELLTSNASALASALEPAADRARMNPTVGTLLAAAVRDLHRQDFDSMMRAVNFAADKLTETPEEDRYPAEALVAMLRVVHSHVHNPVLTGSAAAHLLQILDREPRLHLPTSQQHRVFASNNVAIGQLWTGELGAAESALASVQVRCHDLGMGRTELSAQAHLAILDVIHGRLPAARRRAVMAQDVADRRSWTGEPEALGLFAALALTHLEQGRFDMAASTVDGRLTDSRTESEAACRIVLGIAAVGVAIARRNPVAAAAASTQLGAIQSQSGDLPTMLSRWCAVAHADAHLATGSPERAVAVLGEIGVVPGYSYFLERIVLAKAHLMMDQPDAALDLLEPMPASRLSYRGLMVEALILTSVASERMHRFTAALTTLTEAIELAQDAAMYRPFLGADPLIEGLLARHRHLVARHLEFTRTLSASFTSDYPAASTLPPAGQSLTEREFAVLSYLPTMLNSAEIAADLFVTANTVKSHQQSIYRKLGVNTRRSAVDTARTLNLI